MVNTVTTASHMRTLYQRLCAFLKHHILDGAHPLPERVEIFPGPPGSVERAIVQAVMAHVNIGTECAPSKGEERPTIWLDGDELGVHGCFAICRYLGRLWRLHPTTPQSTLAVDGMLELLAAFVKDVPASDADVASHVCAFLTELELRLEAHDGDAAWLESFESRTVADVCWHAALVHVMKRHQVVVTDETHPRVVEWLDAMEDDDEEEKDK